MNFNSEYLPRADVVFSVMFESKELCEKTLEIILGEHIELVNVTTESKNTLHKAAHNSIYFDVKTQATDGRIFSLDLQRKYRKETIRNRTVYYACNEIASQKVEKGEYNKLKNVVVTFLLTEASLNSTTDNSTILLKNDISNEIYSNLLTIHEVNIKHISKKHSIELQILREFLEIDIQEKFDTFMEKYSCNPYGKMLLNHYEMATSDISLLDKLSEEAKFMLRLTEEERLEAELKGLQEGKEEGLKEGKEEGLKEGLKTTAQNMLKENLPIEIIIKCTGLSKEEITQLK